LGKPPLPPTIFKRRNVYNLSWSLSTPRKAGWKQSAEADHSEMAANPKLRPPWILGSLPMDGVWPIGSSVSTQVDRIPAISGEVT